MHGFHALQDILDTPPDIVHVRTPIAGLLTAVALAIGLATPTPTATPTPRLAITAVSASSASATTESISWTVSAPATGQVEYGTTLSYGSLSVLENSYLYTTHSQLISGLAGATLYHYRTRSTDAAGNSAVSADYTFMTVGLAPTAGPTPTPTPPPSGIAVPASIDATGATNASSALISFVNTVPDGSTIVFKAGGIYRMDAALKFAHRHNLTFEGNGATLRANGGTTEASSLFWLGSYLGGNSGIVIRNFTLVGNSSTPGVFQSGREGAHGILVDGGSTIEVANVTVRGVWGDCLYVGTWADAVSFHDSTCSSNGRNGVTVTSATNLTVQRVAFPKSGYCTFDIEPNVSAEGARNILFLNNTAGTWSNSFFSADGAVGSVVNGVTVSGNTVTGATLHTVVDLARRQNIVFTNNTSSLAGAGPILQFVHIDGLTVRGNVQPLRSGVLASITDSTGVAYP